MPDSLSAFIAAYQTVSPLKLGELWAIPIMLRLGLIENLPAHHGPADQCAARIATWRTGGWTACRTWRKKIRRHLVVVVADMAESDLPLSSSFVAEFCQRLSR